MTAETHLHLAGWLMLLLTMLNLFVPARCGWRHDLAQVSLLNRRIFEVHAFFIVLILALFSALLLTSARDLLEPTPLARAILLGLTVFWAVRLAVQLFYYDRTLWRGKRFETSMHVLFSVLWTYFTAVFGGVLAMHLG